MDELWKPVPAAEFSSRYEVSDLGRVRNIKTGHVLKPMRVGRRRDGKSRAAASRSTVRFSTVPLRDFHVAQLVLEAFIGARPIAHVIMHLDDNTDNNALSNLRWGTARENVHDMVRKGRCGGQVLTLEQVGQIIRRRSAGERGRALAIEFGISEQRICDLYKGRTILGGGILMGEKSYRDLCREIGIRMDTPEDEEKILLLVNMVLWGIDDVREARGKLKQLRRNTDEYKT